MINLFLLWWKIIICLLFDVIQLLSARYMAQKTVIGQDRIVYSTRTDLVEQELDRRFQEIEKSDLEKDTITW